MEFNIEIRKKQLESLDQFVSASKSKLQSILSSLGWSVDKIKEKPSEQLIPCPFDTGHKIPEEKITEHIARCQLRSLGYDPEGKFLSEPGNCPKESSIKIDTMKKIEVLSQAVMQTPYFQTAWNGQDPDPHTYNRLLTTFSKDERLALYEYCISNTKGPPELPEFDTSTLMKKEEKDKYSEEALLSFQRDIKRRSVKYKPIHTNNKNYKEVLREVINSEMQQYKDWLSHTNKSQKGPHTPECEDEIHEDILERPCSSTSRISNHSSGSHSTSRKYIPSHKSRNHSREYNYKEEVQSSKYNSTGKHRERDDNIHIDKREYYEESSKSRSRGSSIHSSYKIRRGDNSESYYKKRSRSSSGERKKKHYYSHRSRSRHRSKERNHDTWKKSRRYESSNK